MTPTDEPTFRDASVLLGQTAFGQKLFDFANANGFSHDLDLGVPIPNNQTLAGGACTVANGIVRKMFKIEKAVLKGEPGFQNWVGWKGADPRGEIPVIDTTIERRDYNPNGWRAVGALSDKLVEATSTELRAYLLEPLCTALAPDTRSEPAAETGHASGPIRAPGDSVVSRTPQLRRKP